MKRIRKNYCCVKRLGFFKKTIGTNCCRAAAVMLLKATLYSARYIEVCRRTTAASEIKQEAQGWAATKSRCFFRIWHGGNNTHSLRGFVPSFLTFLFWTTDTKRQALKSAGVALAWYAASSAAAVAVSTATGGAVKTRPPRRKFTGLPLLLIAYAFSRKDVKERTR